MAASTQGMDTEDVSKLLKGQAGTAVNVSHRARRRNAGNTCADTRRDQDTRRAL
jgi:hypothetical protein